MRENEIQFPEQIASNRHQDRDFDIDVHFDGACDCGDSLQTICIAVPDHSEWRKAFVAWCMDCQKVCGTIVTSEAVDRPYRPTNRATKRAA